MSLDEFNKVTPANFSTKTENFQPSAYKNLNLEALPNVMANEGKQKKIIASLDSMAAGLGSQANAQNTNEVEIVSYEEATGSNLSDSLSLN